MALKPVTVSQLNEYISRVLMTDPLLGNVTVTGEISNLKYHSSGHVYFSINDENSKINCFFPASYVKKLSYELGDGLQLRDVLCPGGHIIRTDLPISVNGFKFVEVQKAVVGFLFDLSDFAHGAPSRV